MKNGVEMATETLIGMKLDEKGFHDIFNKYYAPLCLFADRFLEDRDTASDIVQDVFVMLWQIRDHFLYLHQVKSFLYTSVRNKSLNELEHSKVVLEYARKTSDKATESFYHDAVVEEETYRILAESIDKLPEQMRAIMLLAWEGKKNAEIAELLNISVETVHTLKKMAYKKLRVYLKDYYYLLLLLM